MESQTEQDKLHDLLYQELSDDELRELLERLGEIEFDWSPKTTVADVVEATSSDPVAVGRLLAEIRKEDWEERFGLRLTDVEERIQRIEVQRLPHELPIILPEPRPFELLPHRFEAETQSSRPVLLALVIFGALIVFLIIFGTGLSHPPPDINSFRPG